MGGISAPEDEKGKASQFHTSVSDYKRAISSVKESSLGGKQFSGRKSVLKGTV